MTHVSRRTWMAAIAAAGLIPSTGRSQPADVEAQKLANRMETWGTFARRTRNVLARYQSTRKSSLLLEPLVNAGTLGFIAPDHLVLRDDGMGGTATIIRDGRVSIVPNDSGAPAGPPPDQARPGLAWIRDRLIGTFAPGDGSALLRDCRTEVPRGGRASPRLRLLPPLGSAARQEVRSYTLSFDPVGGAVLKIDIKEAQGDEFVLTLADHRRNLEPEDLARIMNG